VASRLWSRGDDDDDERCAIERATRDEASSGDDRVARGADAQVKGGGAGGWRGLCT
jgi:hypothetical protein